MAQSFVSSDKVLFTSESVTEGHPDKICDQVSDAVLDECLRQDRRSRVALETAVKTGLIVLLGEITTSARIDYPAIARRTVERIGFNDGSLGFGSNRRAVVIAAQHDDLVSTEQLREAVNEEVINKVVPAELRASDMKRMINATARFIIGGPMGDSGVTGRKIIVDTYGGMGHHGGGAFSGKDPSKVDRSAAYAARWVAKNVVAAGLARRCEVQVAYAIGVAEPVSVMVETFGTHTVPEEKIEKAVRATFSLKPASIIRELDLLRPIYEKTAAYGHFGRTEPEFTWERTDRADALRQAAGLKGAA